MIEKFQYLKKQKRDNIQQPAQEFSQKSNKNLCLNTDKSLKIHSFKWTICLSILICQNMISSFIKPVNAGGMVIPGKLEGVGYREPDLQVPKSSYFISENPQGISYASFSGGTNIFVKSYELNDDPQTNQVFLHSNELNIDFQAPLLSEDDTFNSHPMLGFITYRLPSLAKIMGVTDAQLAKYQYLSFQLSISTRDNDLNMLKSLNCIASQKSYCLIQFRRSFTPVFYYLQPPVVYYQSTTSVIFDPRSTQGLNIDLPQESKPFTNTKIGGFQIDFSGYVDETTYFTPYYFPNAAMGQIGQIPPSKSLPVSFLWEDGYASIAEQRATFCSYDNSSCYMSKIVPVIFDLSQNLGYVSGGQNLSIKGFGFMGGNISVSVAGLPCQVSFFTNTQINCQVSPSSDISNVNGTFIGSNGLRRTIFNGTSKNFVSFNSLKLSNPSKHIISKKLTLQMETSLNSGQYNGNILQGWFIPPATTSYRFYAACDDQCILKLGTTQNDTSNLTTLLSVTSAGDYRNFWKTNDDQQRISGWVNLTQGQPYYIEANHLQYTGNEHLSVAVEIQQDQTVGHMHSMREIQQLTIQQTVQQDTVSITVINPDSGTFQIIFQNPSTNLYSKSDIIPANANANTLRAAVSYYYSYTFGSAITVTMNMYDKNGDLTTNSTNSTKNVYNITMLKAISGKSSSNLIISKISTKSTIQIGNIQLSSAPLSGYFIVQCTDPSGKTFSSQSISYNDWYMTIQYKIMNGCPYLYDNIEVFEATTTSYHENGRNFMVRFVGVNQQPGYLNIISDPVNTLKGNNITFSNSTIQPYSSNLFYEPIPFEMLQTYEEQPQVKVNVNGIPATCHNLTCNYAYVQTVGQVQSFTFDQATSLLTINGINLPSNTSMIQQINFALTQCKLDSTASVSSTQIQCYLAQNATCGSFVPSLYSIYGLVLNTDSLTSVQLPCTVSRVFPNQYLNIIGGDNLTFVGQYFPTNLTTSNISIQFGDAQQTQCIPTSSSYGILSCTTNQFDQTVSLSQNYSISININGYSIQNSLSVLLNNFTTLGNSLVPNSVSPVLKQKIVLYLQNNFLYTLQKKDFTAMIVNSSDSTIFKILNVIAANDTAKTLTLMFGGSWSGQYNLVVRHNQYGLINTKGLTLTVGSNITSISPNTGSIYGGSLLTITGTNYGNEITDNPIQLSYNGGVGSTDCFVQTTNSTTITCLVDNTISNADGQNATVVVFLKLSEESICQLENECQFTFTSNVPTVTSLTVVYDSVNSQYQVVVQGENFDEDISSVYLLSEGIKQPIISVTYNRAVFQVQNVSASYGQIGEMSLYFPIGTPAGHSIVTQNYSITPKLVSITPNNGSIAGSVIVANIQGVGIGTTGLQLIDQTGASICQQLNITQYGQVVCQTFAKNIISQQIRVSYNSSIYTCANPTSSQCQYQQLSTDSYPSVTSISVSNPTVTLNGQNFITSGFTASVQLAGVNADSVVIVSATQIQATWTMGIPPLSSSLAPIVSFLMESSQVKHFANVSANISNTLTVTQSTQGLKCSFAGGCIYQVTSPGLSTLLSQNQNKNYLSVCQNKCVYQPQLSNSSVATCLLSSMSTLYSNQNFLIQSDQNLNSKVYFGTGKGYQNAFDGKNNIMNNDTSKNCTVGMQFREGYVAILSQVKFFLSASDTANYRSGNLIFQGSMDGVTYTDIYTVDDNVHGGWNYQKWNKTLQNGPKFRFYRFFGLASGSCLINEIVLTGVETVQDQNSVYNCAPQLYINGNASTQSFGQVTYDGSITPLLASITPRFGKVEGGENISFAGTGFSSSISDYNITIDGINCPVFAATSTLVQCTTGPRPGLVKSTLQIQIANQGLASLQDLIFQYVSYWSSDSTWGGESQPMEGESVNIPPGLNLYVDVDSTPVLNLVLVQGSLIFAPHIDPKHQRFFDARYIFVNGGYMQVGTEAYPYTSKLTITMHGQLSDPYIPIYGNKCIGLRYATLEMHGPVRTPTWTVLQQTAYQNQSQITLNEAVDWQVGEEIVIASTDFDMKHAETFFIVAIDRTNINNPVLTLDKQLVFTHFAKTENYGGVDFDIRAEVGLLSRNVVFRGDPETSSANMYGAIIFMHSQGDDSIVGKLSHIELKDVGQAFKVGRYPIHFHMVGNVMQSYAVGNSIHDSNNRAITIHGVHYLTVTDNVAYNIKGHSIFIEDAIESRNFLKKNLVINTHRSWSLLNTDTTPANFWITFPDNDFIGNHAAGSENYGFWFDSKEHSTGPSASTDVCPTKNKVGLFINNTAHSAGRYGLRVFHEMTPLTYPCQPSKYDSSYLSKNKTDPFWRNPPILTHVDGFTGWKCGRNGAIAETMGNVHWNNFKTADNLLAGIEFSLTDQLSDNMTRIFNATIVGRTNNSEQLMFNVASVSVTRGIITPRTENFTVDSVKFYYFDWNGSAALGGCSHCYHPAATDSGARTVTFKNTYFDSTVVQKIRQQEPWRHIYYDLDGTLTGKGPNTYYTYGWNHNLQPECDFLPDIYDGVVCNSSVQVRRLAFWNWLPAGVFQSQVFNILQWDDSILAKVNTSEYITSNNYSVVPFKDKQKPMFAWAVPFVTGHKYKISWGSTGIDFTQMEVDQSERWQQNDQNIMLMHNFSMIRQAVNVTVDNTLILNNTLPSLDISSNLIETGQNIVLNDSTLNPNLPPAIQTQFITAFNGKNMNGMERKVIWQGIQCLGACNAAVVVVPLGNITYWSDANSWLNRNKTLPKDGDSVVIESGWNMILDINTPNLTKITINGRLTFLNTTNITMTAGSIFVYAGELLIGSQDYPYKYNAKIQLEGGRFSAPIAFDGDVEGGNKILANVGTIKMYGIQRKYLFRLQQPALRKSNTFYIDTGLDLVQGDQLGLLPTSYNHEASDQVFVQTYNNLTGLVTINSTLSHYHWGANVSTASKYNGVDIRGEVVLLTRNIQIVGSPLDGWGGQVVTSSTVDANMTTYNGITIMDGVEISGCSQSNTLRAALRFDGNTGGYSTISNSSLRNGQAWGLQIINSKNIYITDMVLFGFTQIGANLQSVTNITVRYSVIGNIIERVQSAAQQSLQSTPLVDKRAGITVCGYQWPMDKCWDTFINNNIVGGAPYAGFVNPAQKCGDTSNDKFFNNIAHSIKGAFGGNGVQIFADVATNQISTCYQASTFIAYKCWFQGAFSYDMGNTVIFKNMTMIDNRLGLGMSLGNATNGNTQLIFNDNYIYGESEIPDCPDNNRGDYCEITSKAAVYPGQISKAGQTVMQSEIAHLPVFYDHFDTVNSNSRIIWNRNKFFYFKGQTKLKQQQSIIGSSDYSYDYTPMHEFYDTQFTDVEDSAMAKLMNPLPDWANIEDCGNFPCTGPYNLLYSFQNSVWYGTKMNNPQSDFQIIPNNPGLSQYVQNCQYKAPWNGYYCNQNSLSILLFQSLDSDRLDRAYQPINITQYGTRVKNVLNAFMDHGWDGFYTSHKRVPMFPALIDAPLGSIYNVTYTSTPPKSQQFQLISSIANTGLTVRIAYPDAVSYAIYLNGAIVEMNQWQTSINQYGPIKQRYCGENRYIGVQNILEFFITGNCTLQIQPRDAIQSMVRMEWTMSQFYSSGGTTKFADRLCAALGIHSSRMKVVSVYEGSLVINYNIVQDTDSSQSLAQISQLQTQVLATGSVDLGAPILDASSSFTVGNSSSKAQSIIKNGVVTAGGFTPVSINSQSSNTNNQPKGVYIPDVPIIQQQQTIYRNVSVQVVTQSNQSQSDINVSNQSLDSGSSKSWIAIPIVLGIFFIIVVLVGVKWYVNTKKVKESDLLAIKAAKLRQQELAQYNTNQKLKGYDESVEDVFSPEKQTKNGQKFQEVARSSAVEEYSQQYDPNNDFAIFGIGDKTKGGIQNLKEKMNLADVLENEELSSDDERQIAADEKTNNQSQSASNQNSNSQLNSEGNTQTKPTSSQTVRNPNPQSEQNNMPENQEIYEL